MKEKDWDVSVTIMQIFDLLIPFTVCSSENQAVLSFYYITTSVQFLFQQSSFATMFLLLVHNVICSLGNAGHGVTLKIRVIGVRTVEILFQDGINYLWSYCIILTIASLANSVLFV